MTDETPDQNSAVDQAFEADDVFSLEDIDKLIEEDSPEFMSSMTEIKGNQELNSADIEPLHSSSENLEDDAVSEIEEELKPSKLEKLLAPIKSKLAPLKKISEPITKKYYSFKKNWALKKIAFRNKISEQKSEFIEFLKKGLPERLKFYKKVITQNIKVFINWVLKFRNLTLGQKVIFVLSMPAAVGLFWLGAKSLNGSWVPMLYSKINTSLEEQADSIEDIKSDSSWVELQQAFPQPEYTVEVTKVVFNLTRDSSSGETPMGTAQVYLNVDSQDTAIEVKDREKEMMSLIRQAGEEFTYAELNSSVGKSRFKSVIKQSISDVLNHGRVRNVYFKFIVIKP